MISVLIPVLKQGFLESQLAWLSQQTRKDFVVIAMDINHNQNKGLAWAKKSYPFDFHYLPVIQNISYPKRFDFSIKNNLALIAPTEHFVFLSDTAYITEYFIELAIKHAERHAKAVFEAPTVSANGFDSYQQVMNISGITNHTSKPVFLFNRSLFFHVLHGFDEAFTYASGHEFIVDRMAAATLKFEVIKSAVYHISHSPNQNNFGYKSKTPCEKCDKLFATWKFDRAYDTGEFPLEGAFADVMSQMIERDPLLGIATFQCPNCGFGGALNPAEYQKTIVKNGFMDAPSTALDGRTGRNLCKIHETIVKKIGTDMQAKLSYLMTTY